ncbi:SprT family zinc-dependent metalloprotease [Accumulibacter sp.]|uniref:M48 family metallopeptidase n=1 Tax=Accumulibacter sp. TaxID=2053492 RepID=UPI001AC177A1|nr:SprT family zinc-dependent metalloprotease [Accumulibacter sp.]MBN8497448.1 M48 family metallopeptidase [Accumulibacter sp.]MBO3716899.1 M48 family metallopeptidase [Accumulibacter sp.]
MPWRPEALPSGIRPPIGETARTIELGESTVPYVLRRARRRTIGLTIDHRGLRVGAPQRASLSEVESAILRHGEWIRKKLDEWRTRPTAAPLQIVDGLRLPVLGSPVQIRLARGANRCVWNLQMAEPTLTLCLRSPEEAPRVLEQVLRARARALFAERLTHYAPLLGVAVPRLSLSAARTRWGSCSQRTGIRLNWRLIHFPPPVVDYVVAHEVAHLREMNHSPGFWSIVARLYPDYRSARDELKRLAADCPHW